MSNRNAETKSLLVDLSKPDLRTLEAALRNPALRPKGFGPWDYTHCKTCAMEVAYLFWPELGDPERWETGLIAEAFGVRRSEVGTIFQWAHVNAGVPWSEVQPEHVADRIRAVLAAQSDRGE